MGLYIGLGLLLLAMGLGCEVFWSKFRSQNPDLNFWNRFGLVLAPSFRSFKEGFSAKNLIPLLGYLFGGLAFGVLWVFVVYEAGWVYGWFSPPDGSDFQYFGITIFSVVLWALTPLVAFIGGVPAGFLCLHWVNQAGSSKDELFHGK